MKKLTKNAPRKIALFFLSLFIFSSASFGQNETIELTFTATKNNEYAQLDSIWVSNLTHFSDTILYWPDTVLILNVLLEGVENITKNTAFKLYQNVPNPLNDYTFISLRIPEKDYVILVVTDLNGREILKQSMMLDANDHTFRLSPGTGKVFLLTAKWRDYAETIRMVKLKAGNGGFASLEYEGSQSFNLNEKIEETETFPFSPGDLLHYTGYIESFDSDIMDNPEVNSQYTFQFSTTLPWNCGDNLTDDRDGNTYKTILIGNQCWMEENLAYLPSVSPPDYGSFTNPLQYVYDYYGSNVEQAKNTTNYKEFGALYNWPAALTACPVGWHLPSDDEFCILTQFVDSTVNCDVFGYSGTDAGIKMKSESSWFSGGNGTNESGYNAMSAGYRSFYYSTFWHKGQISIHWSTSELNAIDAIGPQLDNLHDDIYRYVGRKDYGFSVRCLKDDTNINQPPVQPNNPNPEAGAIDVDPDATLSWSCYDPDGDELSYAVYFGTDSNLVLVQANHPDTFYLPEVLSYNTTYFWKIIAYDIYGDSAIGPIWSFVTKDVTWSCGDSIADDRDGNTYKTILIGNQCWMEENLAYLPSVSPPVYGSFTNPLYYVYDYYGTDVEQAKNTTNYQEFGALYNWPAALTACPSGWHLPSDDDFCILTQFVDSTVNCDVFGFSGTDAGIKMKSTYGWMSGGNGTNESGYNALSAGYRSFYYSTFWHKGQVSIHWSTSDLDANNAIGRELHNLYTNIKRYSGRKDYGFSVRCLKTE